MGKTYKIEMTLQDYQIQGLFQLYLATIGKGRPVYKHFDRYVRNQLELFGSCDDSLLGTLDEYPELTNAQLVQLGEWGLIEKDEYAAWMIKNAAKKS